MNLFDLVAGLTLVVSALIGLSRGAVLEVVTFLAFAVAAAIAVWALPMTAPIALAEVRPPWAANAVAVAITFLIAYVALRLAGSGLSRAVKGQSTLGLLDRTAGLGFGLVRALVLLGAVVLVFKATPMGAPPPLIRDAKLYPLARGSADMLASVAPGGMARIEAVGASWKSRMDAETPAPPDTPVEAGQAYGPPTAGPAVVSHRPHRRHLTVEPQE